MNYTQGRRQDFLSGGLRNGISLTNGGAQEH